jgi:DNA-binding beta-propeller fold protein YncE
MACLFWPFMALAASVNHPTGRRGLIMVDKVGGYIRFFDPQSDRELGSFEPGGGAGLKAHELAISPDHTQAYVTVYGDGVYGRNPNPGHTIAVVDLTTRTLAASIDISPYQAPHGIQIDSKGLIYVACDLSRKVLVIDPKRRRIEAAIDVEGTGHWLALAERAGKLYVANKNDRLFLSVIDLKTRKMIGTVPMPGGTQGVTASPSGSVVIAADASQPVLHVIDVATDREVDSVTVQNTTRGLYKAFYSPDGKWLLTCLPSGQINIFEAADLHAPQRIVQSAGSNVMGFAFSADGNTVLVGNHGEGTVTRIDLATGKVVNTFEAGQGVETLAYF